MDLNTSHWSFLGHFEIYHFMTIPGHFEYFPEKDPLGKSNQRIFGDRMPTPGYSILESDL